jgi:hypothetical protein
MQYFQAALISHRDAAFWDVRVVFVGHGSSHLNPDDAQPYLNTPIPYSADRAAKSLVIMGTADFEAETMTRTSYKCRATMQRHLITPTEKGGTASEYFPLSIST